MNILSWIKSIFSQPPVPVQPQRPPEKSVWKIEEELTLKEFPKGTPCIFIPNEWEDPVIGVVDYIETEKGVVTHVFDYVRGQPMLFFGFPLHFNQQRLQALLKLDPFERCCLIYSRYRGNAEFIKTINNSIMTSEEIMEVLTRTGFFDAVSLAGSGVDYSIENEEEEEEKHAY